MPMDGGNDLCYVSTHFLFTTSTRLTFLQINEYMEHSEVYETNKMVAKKMMEFFKHRMGLAVECGVHPIIKKPISIYTISKIDDTQLSLQ